MNPDPCTTCDFHGGCQHEATRKGNSNCFWWLPIRPGKAKPQQGNAVCKSKEFYIHAEVRGLVAKAVETLDKANKALAGLDDKNEVLAEIVSEALCTLNLAGEA